MVGHRFHISSPIKVEGWDVSGNELRIRLTFKDPQFHSFITFSGEDPYGYLIHLDGDKTISVMPRNNCDHYIEVIVTAGKDQVFVPVKTIAVCKWRSRFEFCPKISVYTCARLYSNLIWSPAYVEKPGCSG